MMKEIMKRDLGRASLEEGSIMKFYSLDDVSDGRLNYCEQ